MSKTRKSFSLKEKVEIINAVKSGKRKMGDIAREYGIAASSLSTIVKNKDKILKTYEYGKMSAKCKRMRPGKYEDVEEALFAWFKDVRAKNIPVSGSVLLEKGKNFACLLGHDDFNVSVGWVEKFKQRHDILCRKACGEEASVSESTVNDWLKEKLPQIAEYDDRDVFNMDETGLFFRAMPEYTLTLKGDSCHGGKKSKDRVSVALCCNKDGSEKLKVLVIGKSKNPRCMKGVSYLPVVYKNNKKAWMTRDIFEQWLLNFDKKMKAENRKILLLLDNVSSHVTSVRLQAITLLFFPPNATSKMQPLDQGIIRSVKAIYRRRLVRRVLLDISSGRATKIDIRMAIDMLYGSWNELHSSVIKNCFRKAGITTVSMAESDDGHDSEDSEDDEDDTELWSHLSLPSADYNFDSYVDIDADLISSATITDNDIVENVKQSVGLGLTVESESSDDEGPMEEPVSAQTAVDSFQKVRKFCQENEHTSPELYFLIDKVESFLLNETLRKKKQTKITDYACRPN